MNPDDTSRPAISFLLDELQSPINIGKCARVAEIYGIDLVLNDPRHLLADADAMRSLNDFACGAWSRRGGQVVHDRRAFIGSYTRGRVVATCLRPDAVRLRDFNFRHGDLIVFGNEYDGVDATLIEQADARLYIPMPDLVLPKPRSVVPIDPARQRQVNQNGVPNLNVAVAAGIVAYEYSQWLEMASAAPTRLAAAA